MISKGDATKVQLDKHAAAAKALEERIDLAIKGQDSLVVRVDVDGCPMNVVAQVTKKYEIGGWTCKIEHGDQRDPGTTLVLS